MFKSGVFLTKFGQKLILLLSAQPDYHLHVKVLEKIIARTLCAMHHGILSLYYIFNNTAYFLDFRAQKFPLIF